MQQNKVLILIGVAGLALAWYLSQRQERALKMFIPGRAIGFEPPPPDSSVMTLGRYLGYEPPPPAAILPATELPLLPTNGQVFDPIAGQYTLAPVELEYVWA